MLGKDRGCQTPDLSPAFGDTGPPPRRVFVFLGCEVSVYSESRGYIGPADSDRRCASTILALARDNDPLTVTAQRDRWEVVLQARLTEVTAQRDRWEQRFDQLKLPPVNTGQRRPWWRRLAG
jgi:hypothetical protein